MAGYPVENERRKWEIIDEITAAFDGVSREDGVTLHETEVLDDYGGLAERIAARNLDLETKWQDVPAEDLGRLDGISFLDPKGFRYYLPAYLVWYLRNIEGEEFDSNTFQAVLFDLRGCDEDKMSDRDLERFALLTGPQATAVAHFLEWEAGRNDRAWFRLEERHTNSKEWARWAATVPPNDARVALQLYWSQFKAMT